MSTTEAVVVCVGIVALAAIAIYAPEVLMWVGLFIIIFVFN